jgi:predicted permease
VAGQVDMLEVAVNVLFPVFLVMGIGVLLDRLLALDARSISRVVLYAFSPALVFSSISTSALEGGDLLRIGAFVILNTLIMAALGFLISRTLRFDRSRQTAFMLTICFVNAGNYGIPVTLFAFGQEGMTHAVVYFVFGGLAINTLGVYLAALGRGEAKAALGNVFKMPIAYAAVLGIVVNTMSWTVPGPLYKAASLLGTAAVPGMLFLLGVQLSRTRMAGHVGSVALAALMRVLVAPLLALATAPLLGLTGATRQACVLEASEPTAVMTSILALEFQADSEFVASVIFVSTLASIVSLSLLISYLR